MKAKPDRYAGGSTYEPKLGDFEKLGRAYEQALAFVGGERK